MKVFKFIATLTRRTVYVKVDDADAYLLRAYPWTLSESAHGVVVCRPSGGGVLRTLSQDLLGFKEGMCAVHRNGDSLDFRRQNLRIQKHSIHLRVSAAKLAATMLRKVSAS